MKNTREIVLLDAVLRRLSRPAFTAVIRSGVRDLKGFLFLKPAAMTGASRSVQDELATQQRWARLRLAVPVTAPSSVRDSAQHHDDGSEAPSAAVPDSNTRLPTDGYDPGLFSDILCQFTPGIQRTLLRAGVKTTGQFLALRPRAMLRLPSVGERVRQQFLQAQKAVRDALSDAARTGSAASLDDVLRLLRQSSGWRAPSAEAHPVHLPASVRRRPLTPRAQPGPWPRYQPGPDDVSEWSILRKSVAGLLEPGAARLDDYWARAGDVQLGELFELPEREWAVLQTVGAFRGDQADVLAGLSLGYLSRLPLSPGGFATILDALAALAGADSGALESPTVEMMASDQPLFQSITQLPLRGIRLEAFGLLEDDLQSLKHCGCVALDDLSALSERTIIARNGFGQDSLHAISRLWQMQPRLRLALAPYAVGSETDFSSLPRMLESLVNALALEPREATILKGRLGVLDGRRWSLADLGERTRLSRERVRQIERRAMSRLKHPLADRAFALLNLVVSDVLRACGGACFKEELAAGLQRRFGWAEEPPVPCLRALVVATTGFAVDRDSGLITDPSAACPHCHRPVEVLRALFSQDNDERPLAAVAGPIRQACAKDDCPSHDDRVEFSNGLMKRFASRAGLIVEQDVVYRKDTWGGRRGSRVQQVESVLKEAGTALHFKEVHKRLRASYPQDKQITEHSVHTWLARAPHILLWDRGTFIHRSHVQIPERLMDRIARWIERKLASGLPFVSVAGVYEAFECELEDGEIPSESALYSCLSTCQGGRLAFPRYPYVTCRDAGERLPLSTVLEEFVRDADEAVAVQDVEDYALGGLCVAREQLALCLSRLPNVISVGKGLLAHLDNLSVTPEQLMPIVDYACDAVSRHGHVSVRKVFSARKVSCATVGINTPEMLYSLLQMQSDSRIELPGFPRLVSSYNESAVKRSSVSEEVAAYVAKLVRPCSFEDLEEHFVEKLGYDIRTVYGVCQRPEVLRYSRGAVIHLKTLAWSSEKQTVLEDEAEKLLLQASAAGQCYARVSDFLECPLPRLGNNQPWAQALLADLLVGKGRFKTLGPLRNAFVAIPNDQRIESFEDLVCELLRERHDGACKLDQFSSEMQEAGLVARRLTASMLGSQRRVCIEGQVIMLKELSGRA